MLWIQLENVLLLGLAHVTYLLPKKKKKIDVKV